MAIINDGNAQTILDAITAEAERQCRKFGMVEHADIAQAVFSELWRRDLKGDLDQIGDSGPQFYTIVKKHTRQAVNNERRDYMYFSGGYVYDRPTVVHILNHLLWSEPGTIDEAEKRADVKASYDRMSESHRLAIYKRYALGIAPVDGTEKWRLSEATDTLMHDLNFKTRRAAVPQDDVEEADVE